MNTRFESSIKAQFNRGMVLLSAMFALVALVLAFGAGQAKASSGLPGPEIILGPAAGEVIGTATTTIAFALDPSLVGGILNGNLCSIDDGAYVSCTAPILLTNLTAGVHNFKVKASITLLGGVPLCILGICVDPGPISIETDPTSRTFSVNLLGTTVGTPTTPAVTNSPTVTAKPKSPSVSVTDKALAAQVARCKKLKKKYNKHFTKRANKVRARKRYTKCLKVQKRMMKQTVPAK